MDWGSDEAAPLPRQPLCALEGRESFPANLRDSTMEKRGDTEQKGDAISGASGFGRETTVSPRTASSKKLQKVLHSGCLSWAELSVMKFPVGAIPAMPRVHQHAICTPVSRFSLPPCWLFAYNAHIISSFLIL